MANAVLRSFCSVNAVVSSDSADGTSSAANAPWQARAVISMAKLTEAPPAGRIMCRNQQPDHALTSRIALDRQLRSVFAAYSQGPATRGAPIGAARAIGTRRALPVARTWSAPLRAAYVPPG